MQQLEFVSKRKTDWKVIVGQGLIQNLPHLINFSAYTKLGVITDNNVAELHLDDLVKSLSSFVNKPLIITLPAGERAKSLTEAERIYQILLDKNFDRESLLLAFGGGVVGDLTGFVAATYMRGIDFLQIPTTLLAQVDASIGGKTGVNFGGHKNIVGIFYQPRAIISDISLLRTLPQRERRSGLAEVIKYGLIKDRKIFGLLEMKGDKLSKEELQKLVALCSQIKGQIVEEDEREKSGMRALLNFGHTLGHAVESAGEGRYIHGEAISIGMRFAAKTSHLLQMIQRSEYERIAKTLTKLNLPIVCSLPREPLLEEIAYDKKSIGKESRWVLLERIGKAVANQAVPANIIRQALTEVIE